MIKKYASVNVIKDINAKIHIEKAFLKKKDFDEHTHDFSEMFIVLSGSADHVIDRQVYQVNAGDVYVINGDISHGFKSPNNLLICNIMYNPDIVFNNYINLRKLPGFQALFILEPFFRTEQNFKYKLKLDRYCNNKVDSMIEEMLLEYKDKRDGYDVIIQAMFINLIVLLSREYMKSSEDHSQLILSFSNTIAYMENNYNKDITLDQLSAMACMSKRHFCRVFRQTYNAAPIEYIIHLRIEQASNLLKNSNLSITEIALNCGFSDINYFSRCFSRNNGVSPTQYRLNNK